MMTHGARSAGVMIPIPQYPLYSATTAEYDAYPVSLARQTQATATSLDKDTSCQLTTLICMCSPLIAIEMAVKLHAGSFRFVRYGLKTNNKVSFCINNVYSSTTVVELLSVNVTLDFKVNLDMILLIYTYQNLKMIVGFCRVHVCQYNEYLPLWSCLYQFT